MHITIDMLLRCKAGRYPGADLSLPGFFKNFLI